MAFSQYFMIREGSLVGEGKLSPDGDLEGKGEISVSLRDGRRLEAGTARFLLIEEGVGIFIDAIWLEIDGVDRPDLCMGFGDPSVIRAEIAALEEELASALPLVASLGTPMALDVVEIRARIQALRVALE
jgi:hypothetical protein